MTPYEIYKTYLALTRHFKTKTYDYHRYAGVVRCSPESYEKTKMVEKRFFKKISEMREPYNFMVGNLIFNNPKWINEYDDQYRIMYAKYQKNGLRFFEEEIQNLKDSYNDNFIVDDNNSMPYIIKLVRSGEVSIYTASVFNKIHSMHSKWSTKPQFMIFENVSTKIDKSTGFFNIDNDKYKEAIRRRFDF